MVCHEPKSGSPPLGFEEEDEPVQVLAQLVDAVGGAANDVFHGCAKPAGIAAHPLADEPPGRARFSGGTSNTGNVTAAGTGHGGGRPRWPPPPPALSPRRTAELRHT